MRLIMRVVSLAVPIVALSAALPAAADGQLGFPLAMDAGTFDGVAYVQYDGVFTGETSSGAYRVPYRITAPAQPHRGNRTVIVEPPHFATGPDALDFHFGRAFLFSRRFSHAAVGWSTASLGEGFDRRILDPLVPGTFIDGGVAEFGGRTDDEIIVDFARALASDPLGLSVLGSVKRRYLTGFSDSSDPVLRLLASGHVAGVFDLVLPITAERHDPQAALRAGLFDGKILVVNSESEANEPFKDDGSSPQQYRAYHVAGTPHIVDNFTPFFSNETTPASFHPALRAHFLQADQWVWSHKQPAPSTHLLESPDSNGNAITVDVAGQTVARLPFVELGEARFITGAFLGTYDDVKTIEELGFGSHREYLAAFSKSLRAYAKAGFILKADADEMRRRAALCPPLTYTEVYRDHYARFAAITPCAD
jgi:hypothetical protein